MGRWADCYGSTPAGHGSNNVSVDVSVPVRGGRYGYPNCFDPPWRSAFLVETLRELAHALSSTYLIILLSRHNPISQSLCDIEFLRSFFDRLGFVRSEHLAQVLRPSTSPKYFAGVPLIKLMLHRTWWSRGFDFLALAIQMSEYPLATDGYSVEAATEAYWWGGG